MIRSPGDRAPARISLRSRRVVASTRLGANRSAGRALIDAASLPRAIPVSTLGRWSAQCRSWDGPGPRPGGMNRRAGADPRPTGSGRGPDQLAGGVDGEPLAADALPVRLTRGAVAGVVVQGPLAHHQLLRAARAIDRRRPRGLQLRADGEVVGHRQRGPGLGAGVEAAALLLRVVGEGVEGVAVG